VTPLNVRSKLLNKTEAAARLGVEIATVRNLIKSGALPTRTLGTSREYIPVAAVEEFAKKVTGDE
jgi:excisionase family DNA binding protein